MVLAVHVCQINYDVFMYKRTLFDLILLSTNSSTQSGLTGSLIENHFEYNIYYMILTSSGQNVQ